MVFAQHKRRTSHPNQVESVFVCLCYAFIYSDAILQRLTSTIPQNATVQQKNTRPEVLPLCSTISAVQGFTLMGLLGPQRKPCLSSKKRKFSSVVNTWCLPIARRTNVPVNRKGNKRTARPLTLTWLHMKDVVICLKFETHRIGGQSLAGCDRFLFFELSIWVDFREGSREGGGTLINFPWTITSLPFGYKPGHPVQWFSKWDARKTH